MMMTILCALFGIIMLLVFAIYGNRMNSVVKTGDGDDSRKNIAINSTIGITFLIVISLFKNKSLENVQSFINTV